MPPAKTDSDATAIDTLAVELDDIRHRVRRVGRIVWRGRRLILACLLAALVPTILYLLQATPLYTAQVKLVIEAPEASQLLTNRPGEPWFRANQGLILTEAAVMSSSTLIDRTMNKLHLWNDPEFNAALRKPNPFRVVLGWLNPLRWVAALTLREGAGQPLSATGKAAVAKARIARAFAARLSVTPGRRSYVITVGFTSKDREKAALIANTLARLYVNDRLEASFQNARRVSDWLSKRLGSLQREVDASENAAEEYRVAHNLRRQGKDITTIADQQLSDINSRLILARADLAEQQARLNQIRELIRTRGNVDTSVDVLNSPLIQHLREQEAKVLRRMSKESKIYGDRYPTIVGDRADVAELRRKIKEEVQKIAVSVANQVAVDQAGVRTLEAELAGINRQSNAAGGAEVHLRQLERQADVNRTLYTTFLSRFKRDVDQDQVQRANARVISPATIPTFPSAPRRLLILFTATIGALGFGILLVMVLDRLDNALRSADEVEDLTGLPTLAIIPSQSQAADNLLDELARSPRSSLADSIRGLRVTLELGSRDVESRVILVTSSVPKEGKSFTALALAALSARSDRKVLLIDGDLHRPRLHTILGLGGETGLAQILSGDSKWAETVVKLKDGLDFIPAGRCAAPSDLISHQEMAPLLAQMRRAYHTIVIDCAPVLAVADPRIVASLADRVLYLVKWNSTTRDTVRNGLKLLDEVGASVTGMVLTQTDQKKYSRYAYGDYGSYYGRYKEYYGE